MNGVCSSCKRLFAEYALEKDTLCQRCSQKERDSMETGLEKLNDLELDTRIGNYEFVLEQAREEKRRRDREKVQGLWDEKEKCRAGLFNPSH